MKEYVPTGMHAKLINLLKSESTLDAFKSKFKRLKAQTKDDQEWLGIFMEAAIRHYSKQLVD